MITGFVEVSMDALDVTIRILQVKCRRPGLRWRRELRVSYMLSNHSGQRLYAFTLLSDRHRLLRRLPGRKVTDQLAQTCHAGDGTLHLLHGILSPPVRPDVIAYGPIRPLARVVENGQEYLVTVRAPLPLNAWSVYEGPCGRCEDLRKVMVRRVLLSVDHVLEGDKFFADEHPQHQGAFQVNGAPIRRLQARAELDEPLPLKFRRGFPCVDSEG